MLFMSFPGGLQATGYGETPHFQSSWFLDLILSVFPSKHTKAEEKLPSEIAIPTEIEFS